MNRKFLVLFTTSATESIDKIKKGETPIPALKIVDLSVIFLNVVCIVNYLFGVVPSNNIK